MPPPGFSYPTQRCTACHEREDVRQVDFMPQTIRWSEITEQIRQLPSPLHDRIVAIMESLDQRYRRLGAPGADPSKNESRLTRWVNKGAGGRTVSVIGGTYAEEPDGPLRRVFGVIYDRDPTSPGWLNMRVEMLGIDHEYPVHQHPHQWNAAAFEVWFRDLRRALVALSVAGDPRIVLQNPATTARVKAYVPPSMHWEPMNAFHEFIFGQLDNRHWGYLIHPPHVVRANDWIDYEFVIDCS